MLEAIIIGIVVVFSTMAVARHFWHDVAPGKHGCDHCSDKCSAHGSCPIATLREGRARREGLGDRHEPDGHP